MGRHAIRFLYLDASCREAERKHTTTTNNTEVRCRGYSYSVVIVRRVFHSIGTEACCAKFKHRRGHGGKCGAASPAMRECHELAVGRKM